MILPSSPCARCDGTGVWQNKFKPDDRRSCFTCNGTGRSPQAGAQARAQAPLIAPTRRKGRGGGGGGAEFNPDFFAGVTLGDDGAGTENAGDAPSFAPTNLANLTAEVSARITPIIQAEISREATRVESDIKGWTRVTLDTTVERIEERVYDRLAKRLPQRIELTRGGAVLPEVEGHQHPSWGKLLRLATSRDVSGFVPNIWITGPAGSGKTTGARMLAKALELPFFYNGALETKFEVIGYKDAGGTYHTTAFRQAMEQPSVYLFDDIDSCDSNAPLLALNGALANGLIAFPDKHLERHRDSIVIATANTWGLGANADYVGRTRLDGAFLDRFGGKVHWGYDEEFERAISGNAAWAMKVQSARARASAAGLKVLITPRASIAGAAYIAAGFSPDEAAEMTYLSGLSAEQRRMLS